MIRVLVLYPRVEGKRFDRDYYLNHHVPLVQQRLAPRRLEVDIGIPRRGQPSPFHAVTLMTFDSMEDLMAGYAAAGDELNEDKSRFTDLDLIFQIGEIAEPALTR